jgi:hypothetical protein
MALTLRSNPRISTIQFTRILQKYQSPVAPIAQECYDIIAGSGIDPAIALAFFGRESVFGTRGLSAEIKNWGNVRTPFKPERAIGKHPRNFAIYGTWQDSLRDWCDRINERYVRERGLDTVEKVVPVYAPAADGNSVDDYIRHVNKLVTQWVAEDSIGPPQPPVAAPVPDPAPTAHTPAPAPAARPPTSIVATTLRDELLKASFAHASAVFRPELPLHQYVMSEARAGRPLGNPLGDVKQIKLNGQDYMMQVFALDTLFAPLRQPAEVGRLSDLLKKE